MSERRPHVAAAVVIGAVALIARLAFALPFSRTPLGSLIYLDSSNYDRLARDLLAGTGAALEPFFVEPLYAYVLAAFQRVFGDGLWPIRLAQVGGGAAVAILLYDLGRRLYAPWVGWVAGLAAALYGPFVFYDSLVLKTSGEVLLATLLLWLLTRALQSEAQTLAWATCGLILGVAVLLKANFLVLVPMVAVAPFLVPGREWRKAARHAVAAGSLFTVVLLPVIVRNTVLAGELTFLTNGAGMNFYQGNHPGTDGGLDIPEFIRTDPTTEQSDSLAEARRRTGDPDLTAAEASSYWLGEGLGFVREEPLAWLLLMGRKLALFWNHYEAADNLSFHYTRRVVPWLWLAPVGFWLVAPFGLAGTLAGAGGGRPEWLVRASVALLMAGAVLFHVADRYRLAAVPALILLGAGFLRCCVRQVRTGERARALAGAALVLGAAILVEVPRLYPGGQDMAPFDRLMAIGYARQGDEARAAPYRERAANAYYDQALAFLARGEAYRAQVNFLQIAELEPERPGLWYHLGLAEEQLGRFDRAIAAFAREPHGTEAGIGALDRLARLELRAGRIEAAEAAATQARELAPDDPRILVVLGDVRAMQGRFVEALELFEAALALDPGAEAVTRRIESARARLGER